MNYDSTLHAKRPTPVLCFFRPDLDLLVSEPEFCTETVKVWSGFHPDALNPPPCFLPRSVCEVDERFVQLIPYIVLRSTDGQYVGYRRKGMEERLVGQVSIGFGGHVEYPLGHNDYHDFIEETIEDSLYDEIFEETNVGDLVSKMFFELPGFVLASSETPVDRVHLMYPVLFELEFASDRFGEFRFSSDAAGEAIVVDPNDPPGDLESWSNIAIEFFKTLERLQ